VEHRVVGHEPVGLLLGGEAARAGIDFRGGALGRIGGDRDAHRALVGLLGRGQCDRPGALAIEELLAFEPVLRVGSGLQPEQLFRVAQVLCQVGRHRLVGEEVGEGRLPHLQHRIVGVVDVQRDRAVVGIDDGLHAVADVVERLVETGAACELRQVGVLPVRIPAARGVAVDHPHHAVAEGHRVGVAVERKERCQLLHALAGVANHQQLRVVVDGAGAEQVVVPLVERERQPARGGRQRHACRALVRGN